MRCEPLQSNQTRNVSPRPGERRAGVLPVLALPFVAALGAKGDDEAPRRFSWLDFASRKKSDDADFASSDDADAARRKRADDAAP